MTELRLIPDARNDGIHDLQTERPRFAAIAAKCACGVVHYGLYGLAFSPGCCPGAFKTHFIRSASKEALLEELERVRCTPMDTEAARKTHEQ